jgi:oxaloacetate decarboxylase alpha subunit
MIDELRGLVAGHYGSPPGAIDAAVRRASELLADGAPEPEPIDLQRISADAEGLAASDEELLLFALFGDEARPLLEAIRGRFSGDDSLAASGVDRARAERIREVVRIVQESGIGEITIEEGGMRVSVRRTPDPIEPVLASAAGTAATEMEPELPPQQEGGDGLVRVESPMVGTFYRAPQPGAPPFVEEGDAVAPGQTLCILEAMKLMNEVKADQEAVVRAIHVGNAEPVEYGQLLFELEPINGRPLGL